MIRDSIWVQDKSCDSIAAPCFPAHPCVGACELTATYLYLQEATREAEVAGLKLRVSAHVEHIDQLLSDLTAKDANFLEASNKLDSLTKQLASHRLKSEETAAAKEAVIAEMSEQLQEAEAAQAELAKQLQDSEAGMEAAVSELSKQLQDSEADREAAVSGLTMQLQLAQEALQSLSATKNAEIGDLVQELASSEAELVSSLTNKASELANLTQQLQASQQSLSELAARAVAVESQLTECSREVIKQQELVKKLQASETDSQARLLTLTESSDEQVSLIRCSLCLHSTGLSCLH